MPMQPVRYTVSSTELLYERAMAKFYQAVANENAIEIDKIERFSTKKLSGIGVDNLERRQSLPYGNIEQIIAQTVIKPLNEVAVNRRLSTETSEKLLAKNKNGEDPSYAFDVDDLIENRNHFQKPVKNLESSPIDKTSSLDRSPNKKIKIVEDVQVVNEEEVYSSDYTDSTVSSSDSIVAKMASLKERLLNIESDGDEESKTYHPPSIDLRSLTSPYKLPEHGQAVNVLTKPHRLPDPNFVPKPILKRPTSPIPTSMNVSFSSSPTRPPSIPKIRAFSPPPQSTTGSPLMIPPSPEQIEMSIGAKRTLEEREHTSKKGIKNFFKKITTSPLSSKEKLNMKQKQNFIKETQLGPALLKNDQFINTLSTDLSEPSVTMLQTLTRPQIKASNERGRKLLQQRQNSEEENKTVIDHYTTILRDTVQTAKDKIPIYLNRDAIKKEHEKAKEEGEDIDLEEEQNKPIVSQDKRELDLNALTFIRRQRSKDSSVNQSLQSRDQSIVRNQIKGQFSATIVLTSNFLPKNSIDAFCSDRRSTHSFDTLPSKQLVMSQSTKYLPLTDITVSRFNNTEDVFNDNKKLFQYSRSENESQISTQSKTPEELDVENRLKSNMSYVMDVCLLGFSFYLYIFKDAVFCIPILILLIYRHLGEVIKKNPWLSQKKN